jgi:non-heme chloroperoxidase
MTMSPWDSRLARLSIYEGIGHAPFYEDAPRFNSELAAFVRAAVKTD